MGMCFHLSSKAIKYKTMKPNHAVKLICQMYNPNKKVLKTQLKFSNKLHYKL